MSRCNPAHNSAIQPQAGSCTIVSGTLICLLPYLGYDITIFLDGAGAYRYQRV